MQKIKFHIKQNLESGGFFVESIVKKNEQIITQGDTLVELENNIKDAIKCHFDNPKEIKYELVVI